MRSPKHALSKGMRPRRLWLLVAFAVLIGVAAASTAMARHATRVGGKAHSARQAAKLVAQAGTPRVSSIELRGSVAVVTGTASAAGADATRTLWYESLEGAAFAQQTGATSLTRTVLDAAGKVLSTETDPVELGATDAFAAAVRSSADLARGAQERASTLGATVVESRFVPLFGGTAEFVIEPNDPTAFVAMAGVNAASLLGDLRPSHSPYLVTIVDARQAPLLILGYSPGVGGGSGQGIAWQSPDVQSDAIHGASGQGAKHFLP